MLSHWFILLSFVIVADQRLIQSMWLYGDSPDFEGPSVQWRIINPSTNLPTTKEFKLLYFLHHKKTNLVFEHFEPLNIVKIEEGRFSHYNPHLTDPKDPILVQVGGFSYVYSKAGVYYWNIMLGMGVSSSPRILCRECVCLEFLNESTHWLDG